MHAMSNTSYDSLISPTEPLLRYYIGLFGTVDKPLEDCVDRLLAETRDVIPPDFLEKRIARDQSQKHHVTLAHPKDIANARVELLQRGINFSNLDDVYKAFSEKLKSSPVPNLLGMLGVAYLDDDDPEIYLIPVVYPNGAYVRRCLGISPKNFHVSIGFAEKDTLDDSRRSWFDVQWVYRDGDVLRVYMDVCEEWLRKFGTASSGKEAVQTMLETYRDLCSLPIIDEEWLHRWLGADSTPDENAKYLAKADLLCIRSRLHGKLGAFNLALQDALEALAIVPDSALCICRTAACYVDMGDKSNAMKYIERGLRLAPTDPLLQHLSKRAAVLK